jgi:hypothetical protein
MEKAADDALTTTFIRRTWVEERMTPYLPTGMICVVVRVRGTCLGLTAEAAVEMNAREGKRVEIKHRAFVNTLVRPEHAIVVDAYLESVKAARVMDIAIRHYA